MPQLKFRRKLGTTWVFPLTWLDRDGDRQALTGWTTPKAFWRTLDSDALVDTDTTNITLDESGGDSTTFGDFTYRRLANDQAEFVVGTYRLDFEATLSSEIVPNPEDGYVIVEVLA